MTLAKSFGHTRAGEALKEERLALQKFLSGDDGILAFSILDIWPTLFI